MSNKKTENKEQNHEKFQRNHAELHRQNTKNSTLNNKNGNKQYMQKQQITANEVKPNYHLIPIFMILCILPLITRLKIYNTDLSQFSWFDSNDYAMDFFLYYKQKVFIIIVALMLTVIVYKAIVARKSLKFTPLFAPMAIYVILALLSTLFSDYLIFSVKGSFELFESIFVILGYVITIYFVFQFINTEHDFKLIFIFILTATILLSLLGVLQYMGYDFYGSEIGFGLTVPKELQSVYRLDFVFGEKMVYMSLYNPNYVGVYTAFLIPILLIMLFFQRNILLIITSILSIIGLTISMIGSGSMAGAIGLGVAVLSAVVLMWRCLIRRFYITIPVLLITVIGLLLLNSYTDKRYENELKTMLKSELEFTRSEFNLKDMETKADHVELEYKGNQLNVQYNTQNSILFTVSDKDNNPIEVLYDDTIGMYRISDERFSNILIGLDNDYLGAFFLQIEGRKWRFTNITEDGTYYYVNAFNKLDKMITAPSAVFTGYERYATGRGYIWSRTIPMLKDYILLGSGPDTYTMAFPQQDYMNMQVNGFGGTTVLTKPHSLYLQMAIQTGGLSLLAFLIFYFMYFVSSVRLYIRGRFSSYYAKFGVAIFIGTISYMVTGLANDSNINTAPTFWVLMGVGIALNHKAKPLIREEISEIKAKKAEKRAAKKASKVINADMNEAI